MNSRGIHSMAFLGIMMKSIPVSVAPEFSKIFLKGFRAKTFKDIAQKSGATLKGSDKIILDKFEKLVFAFIEAYRKTGSGQVGGGGNSPNQMVRYNPREARLSILRSITENPGLYIAVATVAYNGLLVYFGYNQINIILNEPLAFRSNSQNQPMGSALVVHDEGGNQVAVIDLTELELPPVTLYDVFFNTREAMQDIATDITLQLEQAKQNAIATAKNEITTQFNERRQNYIDKLITDMGLDREQASAFRRLAAARNLVNGEQFGRAGEDAVRGFRRFGEDIERLSERVIQDVVRDVGRSIEDQSVTMIRTVQDASPMMGEGTFYFFTIAGSYLVYRCFRGRCSSRHRNRRRNGIQNRGGPQFDVLNNNASNNNNAPLRSDVPQGGKRTKRHRRKKSKKSHKKRHRKNKKSHKKRRRRRKKTRKSRR